MVGGKKARRPLPNMSFHCPSAPLARPDLADPRLDLDDLFNT